MDPKGGGIRRRYISTRSEKGDRLGGESGNKKEKKHEKTARKKEAKRE